VINTAGKLLPYQSRANAFLLGADADPSDPAPTDFYAWPLDQAQVANRSRPEDGEGNDALNARLAALRVDEDRTSDNFHMDPTQPVTSKFG
jgi:hypothetical protein